VRDWPPIDDPDTLEWLGLDQEAWRRVLWQRFEVFGRRPWDEAAFEHALGYPWERPDGSYLIRDGQVRLVEEMEADERRATLSEATRDRYPVVAFGANGAPERLELRFAGFDDPADRSALVLTGELHGVDVGAQASPTAFGSVPGALFASPGTAVRASLLWLTPVQLAEITKAELGYRFGRLDRARFTMDEAGLEVDDLFAYVSRVGALRLDGEPVALAAVPATGRRVRAMTQRELLGELGRLAFGPGTTAEDLVRMCFHDMRSVAERMVELTWPTALRLPDDHWTPYPVPAGS
jgi:hypothetical protein